VNARVHPYDMVFAMPELEGTAFPAIRKEAEERGVDLQDHERVLLLEGMGELMRSMLPPDAASPAFAQFAPIVTHAFHYWLEGKQTFTIDEAALRSMIDGTGAIGEWRLAAPARAGYVSLPRNLVFSRIDENAQAEAVDGFFFILNEARLDVLLILGVVPNRAGFSIINIAGMLSDAAVGHFGDVQARETGTDFENVLPGGGGRLYALTNAMEALKLVSRAFRHLRGSL
jgi:hypothetical protein